MPGVTGIIEPRRSGSSTQTVRAMVEAMRHEAFYRTDLFDDARCCLSAGWAIHQNAFASGNPIWNDRRDICLILAGEEFTDPSRVAALSRPPGRSGCEDPRYLVRWYEACGARFLEELNGTYCGVLVDLRDDTIVLFNDRFGLCRVYVHESRRGFYFASEAKSILSAVAATRAIDETALAEFVACSCPLQGRSLFQGVSILPPASRWTFAHGRLVEKECYFRSESWEQLPRLTAASYYEQLSELFPAVVRRYFRGTSPVGMSLTGGLDGRMIMACSGQDRGALPCYTFGGTYRDCSDVAIARRLARDCGQSHQTIFVGEPFIARFAGWAEKAVYVSDGAMDVTGSVELFANSEARRIAPVRMTGNYGSEILRNNVAFKPSPLNRELFDPAFVKRGDTAARTYGHEARGRRLSLIAMKQVPWHHPARLAVEQSQVTMRSPYLDNDLVRLAYQMPSADEYSKLPALRFVAESARSMASIPTDRGALYQPTPVVTGLQRAMQEFTFKAEYAYDYGMPHWLARIDRAVKLARPERLFLGRHKFYHFRIWYRDRLAPYLKEVLLDPRTSSRPHLAPRGLENLLKQHLAGTHNHTTGLHQALSIELIYRQLIERRW